MSNIKLKKLDQDNYPWILRVLNIFRSLKNLNPVLEVEIPDIIRYPKYNLNLYPAQTEFIIERLYFQFLLKYESEAWNKFREWVEDGGFGDINEEVYLLADIDYTTKERMDDLMMYLIENYVDNFPMLYIKD